MKNKKITIIIIGVLALVSMGYFIVLAYDDINQLSKRQKSSDYKENPDIESNSSEKDVRKIENRIHYVGDSVEVQDLSYVIQGYSIGKELPKDAMVAENQNWDGYENQTLAEGYSYLILKESIKNLGEKSLEIGLNNTHLCSASDCTYNDIVNFEEAFTCINGKKPGRDQFVVSLKPDQEQVYFVIYIINDSEWKNDYMYVEVNDTGVINLPELTRKVVLDKENSAI